MGFRKLTFAFLVALGIAAQPSWSQEQSRLEKADGHYRRAKELMKSEKTEEAIAELRDAVRLNPGDVDAHVDLGNQLARLHRHRDAVGEFREGLRLRPDDATILRPLFGSLLELDEVGEASAVLIEIARIRPSDRQLYVELGVAFYKTKPIDVATAEVRLLAEEHPELHADLARALNDVALEPAIIQAREALQRDPENDRLKAELEGLLKMQSAMQKGERALREIVRQEPQRAEAHALLAIALFYRGAWNDGMSEYSDALRRGFDDRDGQRMLAEVIQSRKKPPEALAELRALAVRFPRCVNLRLALAEALFKFGAAEEARNEVERVLNEYPQNTEARQHKSSMLAREGKQSEAEEELRLANSLPQPNRQESAFMQLMEQLARAYFFDEAELTRDPVTANESAAVGSLRTLNTVCVMYLTTYESFPATLEHLGAIPAGTEPTPQRADLIDETLARGAKNGYSFTYYPGLRDDKGNIMTYEIYADPIQPGTTGKRFFFTDQSGVIRFSTAGRASAASQPIS